MRAVHPFLLLAVSALLPAAALAAPTTGPAVPPALCPTLKQDLEGVVRDDGSPPQLSSGIMTLAGQQADPRCASALLHLGSLEALRRSQNLMGADSGQSFAAVATKLAEAGWELRPTPTGGLLRALVAEELLPAQGVTSRQLEAVAAAWLDATWVALNWDDWNPVPSDVRLLTLRGARRFALWRLGQSPAPDAAAWSSLRTLARLTVAFDRPTCELPPEGETAEVTCTGGWRDWTATFAAAPNTSDKLDHGERWTWLEWATRMPPRPGAEGTALAAGLYWRMALYDSMSNQLRHGAFIPPYDKAPTYLDGVLNDIPMAVDLRVAVPAVDALLARTTAPTTPAWTPASRAALAALLAHTIVLKLPDPGDPAFWEQSLSALAFLQRALDVPNAAGEHGPITFQLVGPEVMAALVDGLRVGPEGPRGDQIADALMALAPSLPSATDVLLEIAASTTTTSGGGKVVGAVPTLARRQQIARSVRDTAWDQSMAPTREDPLLPWMRATTNYLRASNMLSVFARLDPRGATPGYRPDPAQFREHFLDWIAKSPVVDAVPERLGPEGCGYLDTLVGSSNLVGHVNWSGIGLQNDLPGDSGKRVTAWLRTIMAKRKGGAAFCAPESLPNPSSPRTDLAANGSLEVALTASSRWLSIAQDVGATSPLDPVRLGSRRAVERASDAIVTEANGFGAGSAGKAELGDALCAAAAAWSVVEGPETAAAIMKLASPLRASPCPAQQLDNGGFRRLYLNVQMASVPVATDYTVSISAGDNSGVLSDWLTTDLRTRVPASSSVPGDDRSAARNSGPLWAGPLVPQGVPTTLNVGDSVKCLIDKGAYFPNGMVIHDPPPQPPCQAALPQGSGESGRSP